MCVLFVFFRSPFFFTVFFCCCCRNHNNNEMKKDLKCSAVARRAIRISFHFTLPLHSVLFSFTMLCISLFFSRCRRRTMCLFSCNLHLIFFGEFWRCAGSWTRTHIAFMTVIYRNNDVEKYEICISAHKQSTKIVWRCSQQRMCHSLNIPPCSFNASIRWQVCFVSELTAIQSSSKYESQSIFRWFGRFGRRHDDFHFPFRTMGQSSIAPLQYEMKQSIAGRRGRRARFFAAANLHAIQFIGRKEC